MPLPQGIIQCDELLFNYIGHGNKSHYNVNYYLLSSVIHLYDS